MLSCEAQAQLANFVGGGVKPINLTGGGEILPLFPGGPELVFFMKDKGQSRD